MLLVDAYAFTEAVVVSDLLDEAPQTKSAVPVASPEPPTMNPTIDSFFN